MKVSSFVTGIATGAVVGAVASVVASNMHQPQNMLPRNVKKKAHQAQRVMKTAAHDMSDILS